MDMKGLHPQNILTAMLIWMTAISIGKAVRKPEDLQQSYLKAD